jgi:hypothetical protein
MTSTLSRQDVSPPRRRSARGRIAHRIVGLGFAAAAVVNTIETLPRASWFVQWLADGAWIPGYPWVTAPSC